MYELFDYRTERGTYCVDGPLPWQDADYVDEQMRIYYGECEDIKDHLCKLLEIKGEEWIIEPIKGVQRRSSIYELTVMQKRDLFQDVAEAILDLMFYIADTTKNNFLR